jgi:hypothetical protein
MASDSHNPPDARDARVREEALRVFHRMLDLDNAHVEDAARAAIASAAMSYEAEVERLREALSFYADPERWRADGAIQTPGAHPLLESAAAYDSGLRAREALEAGER